MKQFKERIDPGQPQVMFPDLESVLSDVAKAYNGLSADSVRLHTAIGIQNEEIDILWWLVGAQSDDLDEPFAKLAKPAAALLAGKELAALVSHRPGPLGASSILKRMIMNGTGKNQKIAIKNLIPKLPMDWRKAVADRSSEHSNRVCPLIAAISASVDVEDADSWATMFAKKFPHPTDTPIAPDVLSYQMYLEWMMVLEIESW